MTAAVHVLPIPFTDPVQAFQPFADDAYAAFLDSAAPAGGRGRYAFIAVDPFRVIEANGEARVDGRPVDARPFDALAAELKRFRLHRQVGLPPFQGGAVGFLAYELGRHLERLPAPRANDLGFPEMVIGLYDTVAAFDVPARRAWVFAADLAGQDARLRRPPPVERAERLAKRIAQAHLPDLDWGPRACWRPEMTRAAFEAVVARTVDYIKAGDIFQANLSQRFLAAKPQDLHPFMLYRRLRALSPAPYAAYLACGPSRAIASASPERFLGLAADRSVETRPIKGTRPRGRDAEEDADLAAELLASEKDRAENLMIVDLLRNDLSRVCAIGSVRVPQLFALESFANVHHLVSVVHGRLNPGLGPVDLLKAAFPGGSITGAPKIRAIEIIHELEPSRRGPYCGTILWIGFDGAMESSIVIRTLTIAGDRVVAQAGGGIVADSDPAAEYEETITKARSLLRSLDPAAAP